MKIAVLGWGHFGRALGSLLTYNDIEFSPVDVDLPLTHAVDAVIQTVPAQFIRTAFQTNEAFIRSDALIINAAKGIEHKTHELPHQIIRELYPDNPYFCLMGPSFASNIVDKDPTLVSLGYSSKTHAQAVRKLLQTPYFRIQFTPDYQAIELAAALKNVYAIICGYAEGLGFGMNTRAKLITLSLQEIIKLGEAMDLSVDALAPGVVGDLVLTCSSDESRNYQFGKNLASMSKNAALTQVDSTVEGFHTSQSMQSLAHEYKVSLPVASLVQKLIDGGTNARHHFHDFVESL